MNPEDTSVLIVGSIALDTVKTPAGQVDEALGGAAVYSSVAASFFSPVRVVGVVGEDFPEAHIEFLRTRRIDLSGLQIQPGKSFRWAGSYEGDMNEAKTLATHLNVFERFRPAIPPAYRHSRFVFLANIDPELQLEVLSQVEKPVFTACDTMNFWIERKREALIEVLKRVDAVFINDAEARQLCGTTSLVRAGREILSYGPRAIVVKKGEHGALLFTDGAHFAAPSYPLDEIVDPTGAGDTFAGGFMGYLASVGDTSESAIRRAIICGSTLASYNVQGFSLDRLRTLTKEDILSRCEAFRRMSSFDAI
jgi:sugar/nucleoside kinase (ribokinase family)